MYAELKELAKTEELELVLFPCGQFFDQELSTDAEIQEFAEEIGVDDMTNVHVLAKGDVKGPDAQPAWKLFYKATGSDYPTSNFEGKYIVSKRGEIQVAPFFLEHAQPIIDQLLAE